MLSSLQLEEEDHDHLQGGAEFNSAPARRLSAAFGLDLAPTTAGNKQVLVGTWSAISDVWLMKGMRKIRLNLKNKNLL